MKLIFIILGLALISSPSFAECEDCFYGAWNLESITDPQGVITTPADLGFYSQIQFLPDSSFIRMENFEITFQGQWMVNFAMVDCEFGTVCLQLLSTTAGDNWVDPVLVENNVLEFRIGCPEVLTIERYTFLTTTSSAKTELGRIKALYR